MGTMQKAQFAPTQARVTFSSLFGHSFPERCVFTSFSQIHPFKGCMVFADPPMADAPLRNAEQVQGNICVIRRGGGSFFDKAKRAAAAGASGIVFVNNANEVFLAECEGVPCNVPSVTIPLGAYERLADLQKCAPIAWFLEVVVSVDMDGGAPPPPAVLTAAAKMRLFVTVVKASGLRAADGDTDLCPFIEILCGDRCRRTRTHYGGGAELLWNQRLSFDLTSSVTSIAVRCHDEESSPSDAAIVGEDASVSLNHLRKGPANVPYSVEVLLKNSYGAAAGSVHLQLTLGVITAQQRSSAARRGVIGVIALEAENVPPPATLGEKGSPFLKVKVGASTKRTPGSSGTHATPVWNHSMRFLMPRARPSGTPSEVPAGSSPLKLDFQLWDECRLGHVPIGCEGSLSLSSVRAKGDAWEGWIDMQGSSGEPSKARVKCSVKCLETPHTADSAAVPDKRTSSGVRSLLDADLALFYMMFSAFVFAVPPLRSCLICVVLPSVLTSTCFLFILLLGGLLVKRRVLVPYLIRYFVGAILGTGHYAQPLRKKTNEKGVARDPRPVFVSDVSLLENLSIYDMYNFWCTGKLALSRVAIPQPTGWCVGENVWFLKAEIVHIEAAPETLWTRAPLAETIIVRQFELNVSVKDCLESNIMTLACNADAALCAFSRLFGKVEGGIKCIKFEEGQIRLVASHLSEGGALDAAFQKEPLVVPVDRMDISDVGCLDRDGSSDELAIGYEAAVKRLTYHLLEAVVEAQRARSSVNMYLSLDPEAVWQGIGDDEDADDDLEEVHSGEEPSSQEEAIVEDSGPEHIAY